MSDQQAPVPTQAEAKEMLRKELGSIITSIDEALTNVRSIEDPNPAVVNLHNACTKLLQLSVTMIGVIIFPDEVARAEAANDEKSPIITD